MAETSPTDISEIIENQKFTWFVASLVLISWVVTFFDGFDMNVIAFVAPDMSAALHLNRLMMGKVFTAGLLGTMIRGVLFSFIIDQIVPAASLVRANHPLCR